MKLLYIASQINNVGGLARIVIEKINWLVDHGYNVSLCNIETEQVNPAYFLDQRVKLIRGDIETTPGNVFVRGLGVIKSIRKINRIIKEESPDLIVNVHCPLVSWVLPFMHRGIPKVVEIHQSKQGLEVFNKQYLNGFEGYIHNLLVRTCYRLYDKFVVLTKDDQKVWNLQNCITIHNYVDFSSNINNKIKKKNQILMLTRLAKQKRIDLMIQIWALVVKNFPDWSVVVYGDGQERPLLERMIARLNLQNSFRLMGETFDRIIIENALEESSILCLTSEYEGSALSLLEAMHKGTAVIAFDILGISDTIHDGANGFVVTPFGDIEKYAEKLSSLMCSKELRQSFSVASSQVLENFKKEKIMEQWDSLFTSFLKNNK